MCNVTESVLERAKAKFMEKSFPNHWLRKSWQNYSKSDFTDIPNVACIFKLRLSRVRKREEHVLNTTMYLANDIIFSPSNAIVRNCIFPDFPHSFCCSVIITTRVFKRVVETHYLGWHP